MLAAEYHGMVKTHGLPLPGAIVTATLGAFSFRELSGDVWTIEVEMLAFEKLARDVGITPGAPSPQWELKWLPGREQPLQRRSYARLDVNLSRDSAAAANEGAIQSTEPAAARTAAGRNCRPPICAASVWETGRPPN